MMEVSNWKEQIIAEFHLNECPSLETYLNKKVAEVIKPKSLADRLPFPLTPLADLLRKPYKPNWLIKNVVLEDITCMIYGEPASRKSFIVQQMGFCIATGTPWHGNEVTKGAVVYVAGEGQAGLRARFKALEKHYGVTAENFYVSDVPATLIEQESIIALEDSISTICEEIDEQLKLLIIDTLHRNMGGDENSASDVSLMLNNLDKLRNKFKCTILLVHHTGHSETGRARGSSSLRAAMDMEYKIQTKNDLTTMTCTKSKDFEEPKTLRFEPLKIETGDLDEAGNPISSLVLEQTEASGFVFESKLTQAQQTVLSALEDALDENGLPPNDVVRTNLEKLGYLDEELPKKVVHKACWREQALRILKVNAKSNESDAKRKAFDRAAQRLEQLGRVKKEAEYYWT